VSGAPAGAQAPVPVLVTGATGFLGGHLAAALSARGFAVRALVRESSDLRRLDALGVEVARGDVTDPASLARAAAGQRVVFHAAAKVSDWAPRAEFQRVNVGGTQAVLTACRSAGVQRLVHVSSLTVLGLPRDSARVDEQSPTARGGLDPYTATKLEAEERVRAAHGQGDLETTVVRPGVIWGPGDVTILPRLVALLQRGRMPWIDHGRNVLGLSHVANLSLGLIQAATAPAAAGQVYHLTDGEEITAREAIEQLAATVGTAPPRVSLPFPAVYALAAALELAARLTRRERPPAMTRYGVRLVACDCRYEITKAARELGYVPVISFRDGIGGLFAPAPERPHGTE
jgi:nucleoside-diphosphate-sugar epimerase